MHLKGGPTCSVVSDFSHVWPPVRWLATYKRIITIAGCSNILSGLVTLFYVSYPVPLPLTLDIYCIYIQIIIVVLCYIFSVLNKYIVYIRCLRKNIFFDSPVIPAQKGCFSFKFRARPLDSSISNMGYLFVLVRDGNNAKFPVWNRKLQSGNDWSTIEIELNLISGLRQVSWV